MTEPAAYLQLDIHGKEMVHIEKDMNGYETKPLYTAEQLHPRVKMTQAEFDEFKKLLLIGTSTIYVAFDEIVSGGGETDEFEQLYNRLFTNGVNGQVEQQNEFATLWANYNPDDPEETIEIVPVPDKKWFVQIKNENEKTRFLHKNILDRNHELNYGSLKYYAKHFDTKEEAEKWTNPLTEAVQLPVEDE